MTNDTLSILNYEPEELPWDTQLQYYCGYVIMEMQKMGTIPPAPILMDDELKWVKTKLLPRAPGWPDGMVEAGISWWIEQMKAIHGIELSVDPNKLMKEIKGET